MRALVIEDEAAVAQDIAQALTSAGFVVDLAAEGEDAWYKGSVEDYDVAVLDLGLPRIDGLSVLKRWRGAQRIFPVLILSARNDWTEKVAGIEAGADDYLGKPFEMGELIARVRGLVRRAAGRASSTIAVGQLTLDTHRMSATYAGRPIRLSQLEFRFLEYLEAGYNGCMFGGAAAVAPLMRQVAELFTTGRLAEARNLEREMKTILYSIYGGESLACWLTGLKYYMVCRELFASSASFLGYPLTDECRTFIERYAAERAMVSA